VPPIILYDYQTTRHSKHPKAFLRGFKGYLHVDYADKKIIPIIKKQSHKFCDFFNNIGILFYIVIKLLILTIII
jgi:hypothetical protein